MSVGLVAERARPAEAGAGYLFGPAGLGGKILKYSYLCNSKHFQQGIYNESNMYASTYANMHVRKLYKRISVQYKATLPLPPQNNGNNIYNNGKQ